MSENHLNLLWIFYENQSPGSMIMMTWRAPLRKTLSEDILSDWILVLIRLIGAGSLSRRPTPLFLLYSGICNEEFSRSFSSPRTRSTWGPPFVHPLSSPSLHVSILECFFFFFIQDMRTGVSLFPNYFLRYVCLIFVLFLLGLHSLI